MERYKTVTNRNQLSMMPLCVDDMVAPDSEVRALDIMVSKMDIQSIGFTYQKLKILAKSHTAL